ncbi:uncharacterized protein K441DRAFT_554007 [Cenococcum geophilum 1.58]|uniref:uncharacterized protein n=1 Tax=Cenococcum geophilum 1.58 TaxID=794803 RepID=UPI00358F5E6C|nr:hypothetical protein K441DRAFT_554007 [Cenococcum geophilum 1.58]
MQRPRNRQPPPSNPRGSQPPSRSRGSGRGSGRGRASTSTTPPHAPRPVPTTAQVHPGTAVSIILKADQPTGRQVRGIVGELLTRGDHPRGIKVRLRDGRVGRVQGLCGEAEALAAEEARVGRGSSLADYFPDLGGGSGERDGGDGAADVNAGMGTVDFASATATCPVCGNFEGDEAAVAHHVEEHFQEEG